MNNKKISKTCQARQLNLSAVKKRHYLKNSHQPESMRKLPKNRIFRRMAQFDQFWLTRFMYGLGAWLFAFSIAAFALDYSTYRADQEERQNERAVRKSALIVTSWNTLLKPTGGNTGKGSAFMTLLQNNVDVTGVDLSCEAIGRFENGQCINPPIFSNLEFIYTSFKESGPLQEPLSFENTTILNGLLKNVNLSGAFKGANLERFTFQNFVAQTTSIPLELIESDELPKIINSCHLCIFQHGDLGGYFYSKIQSSFLSDAYIDIKESDAKNIIDSAKKSLENRAINHASVSSPPLFVLDSGYLFPNRRIFWEMYEYLGYCAEERSVSVTTDTDQILGIPAHSPLDAFVESSAKGLSGHSDTQCWLSFSEVEDTLRSKIEQDFEKFSVHGSIFRHSVWEKFERTMGEAL